MNNVHARGGRVTAAVLAAMTLAGASAGAAGATSYANFNRESYSYTSTLAAAQEGGRYQAMVLGSGDASRIPALKAGNPGLKILFYQGIMAAANANPQYTTCLSGPSVMANHPSWILKDQYGRPILNQNHYLMDVGNAAYEQACVNSVIATARAGHFDGVYWDMVNALLAWTLPSGTTVPEYPTPASWQSAMYKMLSYSASQLHANGLMVVANIGGSTAFPGLWQQWSAPLNGSEEESWTDGKQGLAQQLPDWPKKLANAAWSEANHKLLLLHSWNASEAGNTYGLASMLLIAAGEASYSTSNGCYTSCETWYPEYTTAQQLGAPVGAYSRLANSVYLRRFQHGLVVVNPSSSSIRAFSFGGGTYSGSRLTHVSSVSMAPTTGYILLADGASAGSSATFSLAASPTSRAIGRGQYTWYQLNLSKSPGFSGSVTLSVSGLPSGARASFNPASTSSSAILNLWTSTSSAAGTYRLTVTGSGSGMTATTAVTLSLR